MTMIVHYPPAPWQVASGHRTVFLAGSIAVAGRP